MTRVIGLTSQLVGYTIVKAASNILDIGIARGQPGRELARVFVELGDVGLLLCQRAPMAGGEPGQPSGMCTAEGGGHAVLQDGRNIGQRNAASARGFVADVF
jgi:hypothetical protein